MTIITTSQLTKIYGSGPTAVTALDRVSLSVEPGEFVAIMGPSGCGKSTLLHLIGGLDKASGGSIAVDGHNLNDLGDDELTELRRRKMGFVFQFYNLIPVMTAAENAALPVTLDGVRPAEAQKKAAEWLERFGLGERLNHRPDQLSGGQQQRVAIARAIVNEPALLMADEPTGNLDTESSNDIFALLRKFNRDLGTTCLIVTHDPRIAERCDRTITLVDGRVR